MLPLLCALSGCAALIYEVVWLQMLQFVTGSSAVSMAVLLGTFMGGMFLGSLALPRAVAAGWNPLRVFALIEAGIGALAVAVLFAMPLVGRLYLASLGRGFPDLLLRAAAAAVCLLPPTVLMGASMPAIARWLETSREGISRIGSFYAANIGGAVAGCLIAGFYLLRIYDMETATFVGVGINWTVAATALWAARRPRGATAAATFEPLAGSPAIYAVIALSGLCALGAEVVWTRVLSLMFGATVYTFSIILAVFLAGLGAGSGAASWAIPRIASPRAALAWCQAALTAAALWSAWMMAAQLPYWHVPSTLGAIFAFDFLRTASAILPAALLWGASFPLALASAARRDRDPAALVGRIYAANTLGAIAGAVGFSLLLIPAIGTGHSVRVLIALSATAGCIAVWPRSKMLASACLAAGIAFAAAAPGVPWEVIAYGRQITGRLSDSRLLYRGEGRNASVAVSEHDNIRVFHVSGKVEASNGPNDLRLERILGHIPALLHPRPRKVLVVGCGAGITAGSFLPYPDLERMVICEIEPLIPKVVARYFGRENYDVVNNPRVEIVYDDARHYVFTTGEKFDVITSDPIHPWVKGAATLYTREYFELCKRHLNPGGIVTQWVPLYESTPEVVKSEVATFFEVFPQGIVWGNDTITEEGYDLVLFGQEGGTRIDLDGLQRRLEQPGYAGVARSLREVGFPTAISLLSTYAGRGPELQPWLRGAQINRDRNLRLQYIAGAGFTLQHAGTIYEDMLRWRSFPGQVFLAPAARTLELKRAMQLR